MAAKNFRDMPVESRRLLRRALTFCGVFFFLFGAFLFVRQGSLDELFGPDNMIQTMLGIIFMATGIADLVLVRFVFNERNCK
jgi:hypothetical protein